MAKTTITNLIASIKRRFDYDITDADLNTLIIDTINDALKLLKQWLFDAGLLQEVSISTSFKTVEDIEYTDITNARIVGDASTFTGVAGDTLNVTMDGTAYSAISVAASTTIALVVSAINTAVGSTVASASVDGYLVITSLTSGASSSVTIANNAGTPVTRLFTVAADRTQSGIADVDEIVKIYTKDNDYTLDYVSETKFREFLPDPQTDTAKYPEYFARLQDRIYLGPMPNDNVRLFIDYILDITEVTSTSTLPFKYKYDPLIKAISMWMLSFWLDAKDGSTSLNFQNYMEKMKDNLITNAGKNLGMNQQSRSRYEREIIAPRVPRTGTFT